jgi:NAD-dependent SIR2 family protein deacetylase
MYTTMNDAVYQCIDCQWEGSEEALDIDKVESCLGDDELEICPACGSMNVIRKQLT